LLVENVHKNHKNVRPVGRFPPTEYPTRLREFEVRFLVHSVS
jgi:hypothetical protein